MLWCDRLYSQKGKKLIVRTCYYLSFILKYKNINSQCNNVTSGGRFCKPFSTPIKSFYVQSLTLCYFVCLTYAADKLQCLPYPRNDRYSSCVTLWSFNKCEKIKVWRRDSCEFLLKKRRIHYFWSLVPYHHLHKMSVLVRFLKCLEVTGFLLET